MSQQCFNFWPVDAAGPLESDRLERLAKMLSCHLLPRKPLAAQKEMVENGLQRYREAVRRVNRPRRIPGVVLTAEKSGSTLGTLGGPVRSCYGAGDPRVC